MKHEHVPVLYQEVLAELEPWAPSGHGGRYLDGTLGMGGHSWGILYASAPTGQLLALDQDPAAIAVATQRLAPFEGRWVAVRTNFENIKEVAQERHFAPLDGILLDLGFSSLQMEDEQRGFSFGSDAPLDMRLDPEGLTTAEELVHTLDEKALADLIYRYGEEMRSRRIARVIVRNRPYASARALAETIANAVAGRAQRIHPATRTFQALRIAVNDELGVLQRALPDAVSLLKPGGRLAVISFHSLEDRIVKNFFRDEATDCLCPPQLLVCACGHKATLDRRRATRKPITPSAEELARNPRARSAKLRVAERLN
ncbi:MAG: 16S rRNA (cytosine(1402)-N(4))-methyltransferase RsmH [Ardenticatenaceae bacterium]